MWKRCAIAGDNRERHARASPQPLEREDRHPLRAFGHTDFAAAALHRKVARRNAELDLDRMISQAEEGGGELGDGFRAVEGQPSPCMLPRRSSR